VSAISPNFTADAVKLDVSPEKSGKFALRGVGFMRQRLPQHTGETRFGRG
jgi:hypothetical protein